jgi:peptidoglycan DL-endopeptidase CwlO
VSVSSLSRAAGPASAGLAAAVVLLVCAGARAADPDALRARAHSLRAAGARAESQQRSALLELYAVESRLRRAERTLASLRARLEGLGRSETEARHRLDVARTTLEAADKQLGEHLRALYYEDDVDPIAAILGAGSIEEAIAALDDLSRVAAQDRDIATQVEASRAAARVALARLEARRRELDEAMVEARAARDSLARARDERAATVARLVRQQTLTARQVASLTARANAADAKAQDVSSQPTATSQPVAALTPPPAGAGAHLTVSATGYTLPGVTAAGIPVGWGVVAVDPSLIPFGTRMTVPGYGEGVAADTGPGVVGNRIDLWFPTRAEAQAWGRRTVTITLH